MMYRSIVRSRIRSLFAGANRGAWQPIVDGFADKFTYRFLGDTPLGGQRSTQSAMQAWWQRLYRLFPDAKFEPQTIVVEGPPWNTRVMTHVRVASSVPEGAGRERYENEFMQLMTLRWGRITSVTTIEDTLKFARALDKLKAAGIEEAGAPPIRDAA